VRLTRRSLLARLARTAGTTALLLGGCGGNARSPDAVATATEAFPVQDLLASTAWLARRIGDPALRIADCSPIRRYRDGHIAGASHVWWQDTIEIHNPVYGMLTGAPGRDAIAREAGITTATEVICYDDRGGQYAARVIWMLRAAGVRLVRLLDGGRQAWQAAGHNLTGRRPDAPPGGIPAALDEELLAHGGDIARRLGEPGLIVLDTRTADERDETWHDHLRRGAIPGSRWLPRDRFLTGDGYALAHPADLLARLDAAGVPAGAPEVIVYGLHGTLACLPWLALASLGFARVRVYDGSWAEWGANDDWPVEPLPEMS
jgi:thiosulfate/3-mercaptopyruvate sulfurtransferase